MKLPETKAEWVRLAGVAIIAAGAAVAASLGVAEPAPVIVDVVAVECDCDAIEAVTTDHAEKAKEIAAEVPTE